MRRRQALALPAAALAAGAGLTACQSSAQQSTGAAGGGQKQDMQKVAAALHARTVALIDALNAKNDATIARAKSDLAREADRADDAVKSETGPVANRINAAVSQIRDGLRSNDLTRLERARELLRQAIQ